MTEVRKKLLDCASEETGDNDLSWQQLVATASRPNWGVGFGWETYVPEEMQVIWNKLPVDMRLVAYLVAQSVWGWAQDRMEL